MTFVVTEGQLAGLDRAAPPHSQQLQVSANLALDYATLWRTQPQLRTVVDFLARNIAQLGIHVFERVSDTDRKRLFDHPLARILSKPNAKTTRYRLIDSLVHDLGIYDNAFWLKSKGLRGAPAGLVRLPPQKVTLSGGSWLTADKYRLRGVKGFRDFPAEQIVHFRGHNPEDSRWGSSPIETLRTTLAEEYSAAQYRESLWRNGARFSGYLTRPSTAPRWSPEAKAGFRAAWQSQYAGDGSQVGGTPILEDDMDFKAAAVTPQQAQYLEARKLTREEVAAMYHIPLPMVGILDHATFSNISEQHKHLYQDTLGPWLEMIQQDIELQLLPDLDGSPRVYVEFNLADKLKGTPEEQAQSLQTAIGGPWLTRNEGRARMNLPSIDGADELIVPLNVVTGGQASPTDSAPPPKARRAASHRAGDPDAG